VERYRRDKGGFTKTGMSSLEQEGTKKPRVEIRSLEYQFRLQKPKIHKEGSEGGNSPASFQLHLNCKAQARLKLLTISVHLLVYSSHSFWSTYIPPLLKDCVWKAQTRNIILPRTMLFRSFPSGIVSTTLKHRWTFFSL
jgi:hypothetical protein